MVDTDHIVLEKDGDVARVWLNRPHKLNAVTTELLHRLDEIIVEVDNDPNLKVLVLRGRGGTFCSGFDLDELLGEFIGTTRAYEVALKSQRICDDIFRSPTPSVAVIEGWATAGGFEILINCDFAIAEENAKIGDFHMRRGLFGGAGPMYRLPRIVGERKAKELMMSGRILSGREAYEFGLVNAWAAADDLDATVERFVANFTDKSPFQMQITKQCVNRALDADTETLMLVERLAVGVTLNSDDAAEGVSAFLDKREPTWKGT